MTPSPHSQTLPTLSEPAAVAVGLKGCKTWDMNTAASHPRSIRLVLLAGATVFAASAVALLLSPDIFVSLLGLPASDGLDWAMRMIAVTLVALTGNMAIVAVFGSERGVTVAAVVMLVSAGGLGVLTLLIPVDVTWFSLLYAMVGFGFATAYVVTLALWLRRPR